MTEQLEEQVERKPIKPFDPIGSLIRHWMKIAVFGSTLFVLLSPAALIKKKAYYEAAGKLMIAPSVQTLISRTETNPINGPYGDYARTQCERITADETIEMALAELDPNITKKFPSAPVLARKLRAEADNGTYFMTITLEGDHPDGLAEVVNKIMEVYIEKDLIEAEGQESRRIQYLQEEKTKLEKQISDLTNQFKTISGEIGTVDFREAGNIYNTTIDSLQKAHIDAYTYRISKENNLQAVIQEAKALKALPIDADVEDFVLNSSVASQMDIQTYQQIQTLKESLAGLSDNNPDRKIIEEQIENLSASLDYSKQMLKERTHQVMLSKRESRLQEKIAVAESEFEAAKFAENQLKTRLDAVISDKTIISDKILDGQRIEKNIEKKQSLLSRVEDRINELRMESRSPGRNSIETLAVPPKGPAGSNFKKLIVFCFAFAFGSVTFVCVLFDLTDKRIRSKKDILNAIGAKVSWPISNYLLTRTEETPFSSATRDDSSNVVSKAIHSLAIRLDRERRENNAKLAVFTGLDARSGTSEILVNVAYAMTRLCKRVLVIDANLINPSFDRILLENSGAMGLVEHMREEVDFLESIIYNPERQFDVLPAGQLLLMSEINLVDRSKFPPMFEALKELYDFILVDTPPVLVSDFTEFLILNADIVPLIVQGDRSKYDSLFLVGDIFNRLKIKAAAVVLNWGAPRERNMAQVTISRILEPITKRLITSPIWNTRHLNGMPPNDGDKVKQILLILINKLNHFKSTIRNKKIFLCLLFGLLLAVFILSNILVTGLVSTENIKESADNLIPIKNNAGEANTVDIVPGGMESYAGPQKDGVQTNEVVQIQDIGAAEKSAIGKGSQVPEDLGAKDKNDNILSEEYILAQPASYYTIQLMGSDNITYLINLVQEYGIEAETAIFKKKNGLREWYVLISKAYPEKIMAASAVEMLPEAIKVNSPWIRKVGDIQREIQSYRNHAEAAKK